MKRTREKPAPDRAFEFLRHRLGKGALAPLTGQDWRAMRAWFELVELWNCADERGELAALISLRTMLDAMQRSVWPIAKAGIPGVLDFEHEDRLWGLLQSLTYSATLKPKD